MPSVDFTTNTYSDLKTTVKMAAIACGNGQPVVNLNKILRASFAPIFFCQEAN